MRSNQSTASLVGSPILVGAVTTLVTVIAVFLSYNANQGLPFVPTYNLTVEVPDAAGLVKGNEVRIGGKRVGVIEEITATDDHTPPIARLDVSLDKKAEPLRDDSHTTVRPRSPLGLKYLEVIPGRRGRPIAQGGVLTLKQSEQIVELDEVQNALDAPTRRSLQDAVTELGNGLAGRGPSLNAALVELSPLFFRLERVADLLADPRTGLRGFVRGAGRLAGELAPVARQLGSLLAGANTTARALAAVAPQLEETLVELPPTEATATRALAVTRPVLADARLLLRDIRPGVRVLPRAARTLHVALVEGIPVLRRARALVGRLRQTLVALDRLARDPATASVLERLLTALRSLEPTLRFVVPAQTRCNYLGLWTRNIPSTISEGDVSGTWFRTLVVLDQDEQAAQDRPVPDLHVNQYANTGAPAQGGECEAGNEPYLPGQRIGHVPGDQGSATENTAPPEDVRGR